MIFRSPKQKDPSFSRPAMQGKENYPPAMGTRPLAELIIIHFNVNAVAMPRIWEWEACVRPLVRSLPPYRWAQQAVSLYLLCQNNIRNTRLDGFDPKRSFNGFMLQWRQAVIQDMIDQETAPVPVVFQPPSFTFRVPEMPARYGPPTPPSPAISMLPAATPNVELDEFDWERTMDQTSSDESDEELLDRPFGLVDIMYDQLNLNPKSEEQLKDLEVELKKEAEENGMPLDQIKRHLREFCRHHSGPGFYDEHNRFDFVVESWYEYVDGSSLQIDPTVLPVEFGFLDELDMTDFVLQLDQSEDPLMDWRILLPSK